MKLVLPSAEYKNSFIEAVKEFKADQINSTRYKTYRALSIVELEKDFESYVEFKRGRAKDEKLPPGRVPATDFWLVDGNEFIGRISIRHRLTPELLASHGHIGYDIRPSKRGQGYGNKILELALPKAKELGINRVLITCDATNVASRKIIEKNGGVLENQVPNPETGVDKLRFWIDLGT
ncbi:MAG: GCN5-related N-acetyltransferase [Parcubacteria group bacterium GW2011_GWA2_51_10]|nr:MAG: GCN5-related N-acetyltransferase [Parcubacteria group bacterium GW2011_GWA2_51_10]